MSHLQRNLDAIRKWTPATAALVSAAGIPANFKPTRGTDNTRTYVREQSNPHRLEWLGHTSMPCASAEPLIHGLDVGTSNGLGLSIGTGHEWHAFARKLSSHQALFVYEPDAALIRMALDICELGELLIVGKIIILSGSTEAAASQLSAFLANHLGFESPTVMQPLPTISPERRNGLLTAGETLVRRAVLDRQADTSKLAGRVESAMFDLTDATLLFAITPRYAAERQIMTANSDAAESVFIDHHASASIARRLEAIAEHRPKKIVSDLFRNQIGCVPHTIAVETWIPPLIGAAFWNRLPSASTLSAADRVIVHSGSHADRLIEHGIPAPQIQQRPLQHQHVGNAPASAALRNRVAIIADLPSVDPKDIGIELPTHLAVFAAASELIAEDFLTVHPGLAADILRRSLVRANVASTAEGAADSALRKPLLQIIRDVLIPAIPLLTLARQLIALDIPLRLIGDWQGLDTPTDLAILEPFPHAPHDSIHWDDVALLAHLSPTGTISPLVLDAITARIPIIAPQHPTDRNFGALATVLAPDTQFVHPAPNQFLNALRSVLRDPARQRKLARGAVGEQ